ncbi:MAG: hypothetical protein SFW67_12850 [Myxococcaceae bacterium]|nr:hypothetical protein [Myxococcaceae bacterium]
MTFDDVDAFVRTLGPVSLGVWWNNPTWQVGGRAIAWQRPLSKADRARLEAAQASVPEGPLLAVQVESLDEKEALLSLGLPGVFTISHFDGVAAVLIELRRARTRDVQRVVRRAYRHAEALGPKRAVKRTTPRRRPRARSK